MGRGEGEIYLKYLPLGHKTNNLSVIIVFMGFAIHDH